MHRSRFLAIGALSLVLGLVVSIYVYREIQSVTGKSGSEPMIDAMVAAKDLEVGARLTGPDIKIVRVPGSALPPGSPRKTADVIGRGVILPIAKGQFIVSAELAGENAGSGLPSLIPFGMRAVGVRVNDVTSVAGFVTPGTRVDVLMTGAPNGEQSTTTILQNVKVLALGHTLERNAGGEAQTVSVATLLVDLNDAERLILASSEGRVQLILRNPSDTVADEVMSASLQQLYNGLPSVEPARTPRRAVPLKPTAVSKPATDTHEIQVIKENKQYFINCQDGGQCNQK
jgi:pilus assembly protein CpaB